MEKALTEDHTYVRHMPDCPYYQKALTKQSLVYPVSREGLNQAECITYYQKDKLRIIKSRQRLSSRLHLITLQ